MKSEMTKCKKCLYASWLVGKNCEEEFQCALGEGCEFDRKEDRWFDLEFNGEKLLVEQFKHYNLLDGVVFSLTVYRNKDVCNPHNIVLAAPNCRCFLNEAEVLGLLKAARKSRVIK